MTRYFLIASSCVLLCVTGSVSASTQGADDAKTECATAAFKDYNKSKLALLTQAPLMSVDTLLAQRRLEEQFCQRFAQCVFGQSPDQTHELPYRAAFASCLEDESLEKYDAVRRDAQ